jgi:nicotinamide mononucleotide adenylyltransferase
MNQLSQYLVDGILNEGEDSLGGVALFGGGFKPPTKGHLEVVLQGLKENPEVKQVQILVGSSERNGVTQEESIKIWEIYKRFIPVSTQIIKVQSPFSYIKTYLQDHQDENVYIFIGARLGNEADDKDVAERSAYAKKYSDKAIPVEIITIGGVSGTKARQAALSGNNEEFITFFPEQLTDSEREEVFNIILPVVKEMISEEIPNDVINSFDIQDTLIKDVWVDGELQPKIREKLLKIAQDFFDSLELPEGTILKDIKLTGSFANFNWSKFSDVDLHLVLDFSEISDNEEFAKDYFMAKKNLWNNTHDINIFGYPVEVYVEDKDEPHTASGLYSILNDGWITIPQQQKIIIDKDDIKSKAEGYLSILPQLKKMFKDGKYEEVINTIEKTKTRIRDMRSSGLEKGGLYSVENLAFKVLRRLGYVEDLNKLLTQSYDTTMSLNENASYSKDIDVKGKILELTKHMLAKGMNIEPLPKVEFVDGDSENARDFFGKTAYYNPNNNTIVLYTEGRHPKDIVRSFSHEMVHHIQNLENRLGDVSTTNTMEDDNIDKLEQEANLKGTMTFRNWTDSLNEEKKKEKDPFGLNQYARELAQGLEEAIVGKKVECDNCDWSWNIKDGGDDLYTCHKCGHDNTPKQLTEGRYDTLANKLSSIAFDMFKSIHDRGDKEGEFEFSVGPNDEDIYSDQFEFDLVGVVEITDDEYSVDGGANAGFANDGSEITPLLSVKFKIPKNPDWQKVSFDIKDVVRHELEHLTQDGENLKPSKYIEDDKLIRDLINADLLSKSQYFKLEKEVDAMLQGLYFKAKKSKRPFGDVIDDYLNIFLDQETISPQEKEDILNTWRSRRKALSLPIFEQENMEDKYKIYLDMDGVIVDFDKRFTDLAGMGPREYESSFGKEKFWDFIDSKEKGGGVGFWVGMPWMPGGPELYNRVAQHNHALLSSPSRSESSKLGKRLWKKKYTPNTDLILSLAANKKNYADGNSILIDDRESNIQQWREAGGIGILYKSADQVNKELDKLGL